MFVINYSLVVNKMFFKSPPPDQSSEAEEVLLENIPMASIPTPQNKTDFNTGELVVGEGVVLNGSLEVPDKAWVLGAVNGDLKVHSLTVGSTGEIDGKVDCQIADIAGHVKEDLSVHELLIVRASSTITGNIFYKEIDIERGAKISGQLSMI
jgi:cytoskeletal protein CcmA (bactofilin family)